MGVDCTISLPREARLHDIATVAGILLGMSVERQSFRDSDGLISEYPRISGLRYETFNDVPECVRVYCDGERPGVYLFFHFELDDGKGFTARSRARMIALGWGLVDFFGGRMEYRDSATSIPDYTKPPRDPVAPTDGAEWDDFQQAILNVCPLSPADIEHAATFAAYPT